MNNERSLAKEITEGFEALKSMRNNEPVAWRNLCVSNIGEDSEWIYNEIGQGEPLYTHPVKDLEDIDINITWNENSMRDFGKDELAFAKAILRKAQEK